MALAAAAAASTLAMAPAHAAAGETTDSTGVIADCEAARVGSTILVEGAAFFTGPGIDSALVCRVYVDGNLVGEVGGAGIGPAAMVSGAILEAPPGRVEACAHAWSGASYYREC